MQTDAAAPEAQPPGGPTPGQPVGETPTSQHFSFPVIRTVPSRQALVWLARAWSDIRAYPAASLFYGACFVGMGVVLLLVFAYLFVVGIGIYYRIKLEKEL